MKKTSLILIFLLTSIVIFPLKVEATSYTWDRGAATNNWEDGDNWSPNAASGGPVSADNVTINYTAGSNTVTTSGSVTINNFTVGGGSGGGSLTLGGALTANNITITTSGTLAAGANAISCSGNWNSTSGTFTHTGTVTFTGGVKSLTSGGISFNNLTLNKNFSTTDLDLKDNLDINGTLTLTKGNLDASDSDVNINLAGNLSVSTNGNFTPPDDATPSTKTFTFDGTAQTWTDSNSTPEVMGNVTVSSGTVTLGSEVTADNFTISSGAAVDTDSTGKYTINCYVNWTNNGKLISYTGSTVKFNGSIAQSVNNGTDSFQAVVIANTGGAAITVSLAANTTTNGNFSMNTNNTAQFSIGSSNTLTVGKNLTVQGGTFSNTGNLILGGTDATVTWTDDTGSQNFGNIQIGDGTNAKGVTLASAVTSGNLSIASSGTLDVSSSNYGVTCGGNWSNSGTFNEQQGTVTFTGSSKTIGAETFYGLTLNSGASATTTGNISCTNLSNSGTFTIDTGYTLTPASSGTYTVSGTITETGSIIRPAASVYLTDVNGTEVATVTTSAGIYVTLTDLDGNLNGSSQNTVTGATVSTTVDSEAISLTETGNATGVFRNASALTYAEYDGSATSNDGTLEGKNSATITVAYTDSKDSTDNAASDTATGQAFTTGFSVSATTPQIAGSNFTLTITATKSGGSTSTSYTGTVNLSITYVSPTSGTKTLSTTSTSSFTNGVASLSLNYPDCGTIKITATDSSDSSKTGTSGNIVFVPYDFTVVPNSTTQTVNKTFTLTITARNASAATTANYQGTATLSASTASCSTTGTFSPATSLTSSYWSAGVATLTTAKFNKYGSITFTVTDSTLTTRTGTSSSITFYPKDFSLSISDPPASRTFYYKNETFDLTVTARDNDGSTISNYNGTINITDSGISGLSSSYTFTCSDSGSHKFSTAYGSSETTTANITVKDSGNTSVSGSLSSNISIKEATIKVTDKSGPVGKNALTVGIYDSEDNLIEEDDSTEFKVTLSESMDDDSATSETTSTAKTVTKGQATIYVTDNQAEVVTITPEVTSPSSAEFTVTSGELTIGTLTGGGVGIEMWREIK